MLRNRLSSFFLYIIYFFIYVLRKWLKTGVNSVILSDILNFIINMLHFFMTFNQNKRFSFLQRPWLRQFHFYGRRRSDEFDF